MKILITGSRGQVGRVATSHLIQAGHEVICVDVLPPDREAAVEAVYVQADLKNAGEAFALCFGIDCVVHAAAIVGPSSHTPSRVFENNIMSTFNMIEAAVRCNVSRFVFISSESVPGFVYPEKPFLPKYLPIDEDHPCTPQDPYSVSKHMGELMMDAAVRRSNLQCCTLRPTWIQHEGNYEKNLGPQIRDSTILSANFWSYIDIYDLADAIVLAAQSDIPGHEVYYIASPDNVGGRPLRQMVESYFGENLEVRELDREDASGICCKKAMRMLGWAPKRSWKDYLSPDGRIKAELRRTQSSVMELLALDDMAN